VQTASDSSRSRWGRFATHLLSSSAVVLASKPAKVGILQIIRDCLAGVDDSIPGILVKTAVFGSKWLRRALLESSGDDYRSRKSAGRSGTNVVELILTCSSK
jgi:hypothetical protein